MPFTHYNLPLVKKALSLSSGKYLATLSCPDLILQPQELRQVFGESIDKAADRPDTQSIIGWHKAHSLMDGSTVKDTWDAFEGIGVHLTAFDIFPGRGRETLHDLSTPIPVDYHNRFDVLFDCIANQCFDMARVMRNCLEIVRDGGYIVHCLPLTMANQGFYDISPTLFRDFYEDNGAEVLEHHLVVGVYRESGRVEFDPHTRLRNLPDDTMNLVLVRKISTVPYTAPLMRKFRRHPDCKILR
jgi:hypothetical protein